MPFNFEHIIKICQESKTCNKTACFHKYEHNILPGCDSGPGSKCYKYPNTGAPKCIRIFKEE